MRRKHKLLTLTLTQDDIDRILGEYCFSVFGKYPEVISYHSDADDDDDQKISEDEVFVKCRLIFMERPNAKN